MEESKEVKVLVVDDEPNIVELLTVSLKFQGFDVHSANSGNEALRIAREINPDAYIMDVMMPGMDGYETMRAIRANPILKAKPIIAITAKALKDDREKCISAGASDYLPKPVDADKLIELISLWARPTAEA